MVQLVYISGNYNIVSDALSVENPHYSILYPKAPHISRQIKIYLPVF